MTFLIVTSVIGDRKIQIKRGFVPYSYIMQELTSAPTHDLLKHSKGLGLEFSWADWSENEALLIARTLYDLNEEHVRIIVDNAEQSIFIGRDYYESAILHKTFNDTRYLTKQRKAA